MQTFRLSCGTFWRMTGWGLILGAVFGTLWGWLGELVLVIATYLIPSLPGSATTVDGLIVYLPVFLLAGLIFGALLGVLAGLATGTTLATLLLVAGTSRLNSKHFSTIFAALAALTSALTILVVAGLGNLATLVSPALPEVGLVVWVVIPALACAAASGWSAQRVAWWVQDRVDAPNMLTRNSGARTP